MSDVPFEFEPGLRPSFFIGTESTPALRLPYNRSQRQVQLPANAFRIRPYGCELPNLLAMLLNKARVVKWLAMLPDDLKHPVGSHRAGWTALAVTFQEDFRLPMIQSSRAQSAAKCLFRLLAKFQRGSSPVAD